MKSSKQSLFVLLFSIASTFFFSSLATADSTEKVLTLSVGLSRLHVKDVPMLSLSNGPFAVDETSIAVSLDKNAFSVLFANKILDDGPVLYRESRNYRDATATFKLNYVDGTTDLKHFSLGSDAPADVFLEPTKYLLQLDA